MTGVALILVLAVTVEALVEYVKQAIKTVSGEGRKCLAVQLGALAVSVGLCLAAHADLYAALDVQFAWPWIGSVLTGVFASRGANYVNDLITKLRAV